MTISFHEPYKAGQALDYIKHVIESGKTSGDGNYTYKCQSLLKKRLNAHHVLMTTSCTHAMEMALHLIGLQEEDEVIMPSYTFPSTANSVLLQKGKVVFTEVSRDDCCMDVSRIEEKITPKTKAIMVVHYGGNACDMDTIMGIARQHNLYVIEDAAQGFLSTYKGRALGTIGHFGCYSFHETKNISAGEGGALAINTLAPDVIKRAEYIRQKGTNRQDYCLGEVDFYQWVDIGSSFCPSDILMAYLYAQLEQADVIQALRSKVFNAYQKLLEEIHSDKIAHYATGNAFGESNAHIFYIIFKKPTYATFFIEHLKEKGIPAYTHFVPLHASQMGQSLGYQPDDFKLEIALHQQLVRLPLYPGMTEATQHHIKTAVREVLDALDHREDMPDDINRYSCI
ncbi:dTDP-4-amino-4,6-dideoxygalactose transaminase [Vallitalea pronyensis]|uniref:dTDP-4-amino-4,6-dideoxygalactose transaminase n=1 Tax=Vallitalea pronyensis TaxID=1348613 RepID=A0A8J8MNU9_9FIRM|nr:dTDP-4-amino-4,6-dideoxygalactose transaminase [Vallitalea pronyensis]QUI25170.1 dTDP-4-amino-4,6-dideoxygalactose transaminase [Vallitalea pronyensis]